MAPNQLVSLQSPGKFCKCPVNPENKDSPKLQAELTAHRSDSLKGLQESNHSRSYQPPLLVRLNYPL